MFGTGVKLNRVLKSTPSSRRETKSPQFVFKQ